MAAKTQPTAPVQMTQQQFVAEYMAQLAQSRPPKQSIVSRIAGWAEDRVVDSVRNSKRTLGRVSAALEIADHIKEAAYAQEHAKFASEQAALLGYK